MLWKAWRNAEREREEMEFEVDYVNVGVYELFDRWGIFPFAFVYCGLGYAGRLRGSDPMLLPALKQVGLGLSHVAPHNSSSFFP